MNSFKPEFTWLIMNCDSIRPLDAIFVTQNQNFALISILSCIGLANGKKGRCYGPNELKPQPHELTEFKYLFRATDEQFSCKTRLLTKA